MRIKPPADLLDQPDDDVDNEDLRISRSDPDAGRGSSSPTNIRREVREVSTQATVASVAGNTPISNTAIEVPSSANFDSSSDAEFSLDSTNVKIYSEFETLPESTRSTTVTYDGLPSVPGASDRDSL